MWALFMHSAGERKLCLIRYLRFVRRVEKIKFSCLINRECNSMEMELDIQITKKDLYDYQLHYAYSSPAGLFGTIVGCLFLVGFFRAGTILYLLIGLFIILYFPWMLYLKSAQQAASSAFKEAFHYKFSEEGIEVSRGEESQHIPWDAITKAAATGKSILLYTSKVNAFIIPKRILGERGNEFIRLISMYVSPDKVKIRGTV